MLNSLRNILRRVAEGDRLLPQWTIDEASSPYAVPASIPWLLRASEPDRAALAQVLAGLMRQARPNQWLGFYASFRWTSVTRRDVLVLATLAPDDAVELLGAATLNADGYAREEAVKALAKLTHPRAIPYLLLRLGDWVEPVRQAATEALRGLMTPENAGVFVEHHLVIDHLAEIERVDLGGIADEIRSFLRSEAARPALMEAIDADRPQVRVFAYTILASAGRLEPEVVARAAGDQSPIVRRWIAHRIVRGDSAAPDDVWRSLLHENSGLASTPMVRWLSEAEVSRFHADLLELSFSDRRVVRHAARFKLRDRGMDFAGTARDRLTARPVQDAGPGLVATLGETGDASDAARLHAFMNHQRSGIRAAALAGLARVDSDRAISIALARLDDSSGRVRRLAAETLRGARSQPVHDQLMRTLREGSREAQGAALQALRDVGGWDAVTLTLAALLSQHESIRTRGWQLVLLRDRGARFATWQAMPASVRGEVAGMWPVVRELEPPRSAGSAWRSFSRWIEQTLERMQ